MAEMPPEDLEKDASFASGVQDVRNYLSTPGGKLKTLLALGAVGLGAKLFHEGGKSPLTPEQALAIAYAQQEKTAFLDEGLSPLLGGAGGALGGYRVGKHLVHPAVKWKEEGIRRQLERGADAMSKLQRVQKLAPVGMAIIGAILLAALTARKAKQQERERLQQYGPVPAYQYGFNPSELQQAGDPYAQRYYGG
jgi:hypothetical protein